MRNAHKRVDGPLIAATLALITAPALAEVEFEPYVTAGLSYIDNLRTRAEDEQGETILRLEPGFALTQESDRFVSSAAYRAQAYYYHNVSDSRISNGLDARTSIALDVDNLFLDFGASRTQTIRDPTAPLPVGNLSLGGNRIDRDDVFVSPSFQYRLGSSITARASAARTWTDYDADDSLRQLDAVYDRASASLDNYSRGRGFTWALSYSTTQTEYDAFPREWRHRRGSVELGAWVGEAVRLFVVSGKESPWDRPFEDDLEDRFWEAGLSASAGDRFRAELARGERSFGSSARADMSFTFGRAQLGLSYTETPTSQGDRPSVGREALLALIDVLVDIGLIDENLLSRPGFAERYIAVRGQVDLALEFGRTTVTLGVSDVRHEQRHELTGAPLPDERHRYERAEVTLDVGRRTEVYMRGTRTERDFADLGTRTRLSTAVGADFGLGTRTELSAEFEYIDEDSEFDASDYDVHLFTVLLTRRF